MYVLDFFYPRIDIKMIKIEEDPFVKININSIGIYSFRNGLKHSFSYNGFYFFKSKLIERSHEVKN